MKKSIPIGLLAVSLVALSIVGGTMAWFTAEAEPVLNQFTAGTVKIAINEHGFSDVGNWNPGDTTDKDVTVKNEGSKNAYVRVKITPQWGDLGQEGFVVDNNLAVQNVTLNWSTEGWMLHTDGYYYYKSVLPADEESTLLLDSVTLVGADTTNDYQGKVLHITVEAEAVQASNEAYKSVWEMSNLPWDTGE